MNHPLTDKMCEEIGFLCRWSGDGGDIVFTHFDMRRAADWQLEQCLAWLKANLMDHHPYKGYTYLWDDCSAAEIRVDEVVKGLTEAMRPQEDN